MTALRFKLALLFPVAWLQDPVVAAPQSVANLGSTTSGQTYEHARGNSDHIVVLVREDGVDQNGDGDGNDTVVNLVHASTGVMTSTGIAVTVSSGLAPMLGDRLCVAGAREASYGTTGTDLNGDGDKVDEVTHVYDLVTGVTTNLGVAANTMVDLPTAGDHVVLRVHEGAQGADLNGDGDLQDFVLHTWHVGQAAPQNRGLSMNRYAVTRRGAIFTAYEVTQGADLNGDGDAWDSVAFGYDGVTDTITNFGLACLPIAADRDGGGVFAFAAFEPAQGAGTDLNGDGDANDLVLYAWLAPSNTLRNLGYSVRASFDDSAFIQIAGSRVFFGANEGLTGAGTDLNGDGDAQDLVLHVHDARTAVTTNIGLAFLEGVFGPLRPPIQGSVIAIVVPESSQGAVDRNGDGDANDRVVALYDASTGVATNIGIATRPDNYFLSMSREILAFQSDESAQGGQDLNGDGVLTPVVAVQDRATGALRFLSTVPDYHGPYVLRDSLTFAASEVGPAIDLNGDGDTTDAVLHSWKLATGVETNHGLAIEWGLPGITSEGQVFRVAEFEQGVSLNGDADTTDRVLHFFHR
jgi:hypothetical protein